MSFIPQYKGKDIEKVPASKLLKDDKWYPARKFDGQYCQIHKTGDNVIMYSSHGNQFIVSEICDVLRTCKFDFIIEAEFNGKGSDGRKLNDRIHSSVLTHVSNTKKHGSSSDPLSMIHIFDILSFGNKDTRHMPYVLRRKILKDNFSFITDSHVNLVKVGNPKTLAECSKIAKTICDSGGEGVFAFHALHTIRTVGRSNYAVKIKSSNTLVGMCIDTQPSDTVPGEHGALVLQFTLNGKIKRQSFGGLTGEQRKMTKLSLIGKEYTVRYEQVNADGNVVQGFLV